MKVVIRILIAAAVITLGYLCTMSILTPVQFQEEQDKREALIKERLKEITRFELSYKETFGEFASAQQLVDFLENGTINVVKAEGDYTDEMREKGKSEMDLASKGNKLFAKAKELLIKKINNEDTEEKSSKRRRRRYRRHRTSSEERMVKSILKELNGENLSVEQKIEKGTKMLIAQILDKKLLIRDTIRISAKDSLLKNGEIPAELINVPGFENQKIDIQSAMIPQEIGNLTINISVFRAAVPMEVYLGDLDKNILEQKIRKAKERNNKQGYPGLEIGSLKEVKTTGNWE